jgi:hypothetical protein
MKLALTLSGLALLMLGAFWCVKGYNPAGGDDVFLFVVGGGIAGLGFGLIIMSGVTRPERLKGDRRNSDS